MERLISRQGSGMVLMIGAMFFIPASDTIAKLLGSVMSPGQIGFARFALQSVALLAIILATGRPLATRRLGLHAARGGLIALAIVLLFWALQYLPVANAIAIFFVEPLVLILISALFLGEPLRRHRLVSVAVGLAGALLVIRPTWAAFGWAAVLPLGTAVAFAGYLALTRHMSDHEDTLLMQFWAGLFGGAFLLIGLLVGALLELDVLTVSAPDAHSWGLLIAMAGISTVAHLLITSAFQRTPAAILAPFQYLEIISATALGFLVFGDLPDTLTFIGTALIIGSGLFVFVAERGQPAH